MSLSLFLAKYQTLILESILQVAAKTEAITHYYNSSGDRSEENSHSTSKKIY